MEPKYVVQAGEVLAESEGRTVFTKAEADEFIGVVAEGLSEQMKHGSSAEKSEAWLMANQLRVLPYTLQ